jgi:hypothetical protein
VDKRRNTTSSVSIPPSILPVILLNCMYSYNFGIRYISLHNGTDGAPSFRFHSPAVTAKQLPAVTRNIVLGDNGTKGNVMPPKFLVRVRGVVRDIVEASPP